MTFADGYFRYPHINGDVVTFVAEDDVWVAPLGGRAWRVSADQVPVSRPRFSPDGSLLAWASTVDGAPEVHVAPVEGGPARRLTYWSSAATALLGWTPDGEPLALSTLGRMSRAHPWAFAVPLDGGPARRLPYGRLGGLALEPGGSGVLLSTANGGREPAHWKRYRGGRAGKLWLRTDGAFERVHQELDGNIDSPMWVGDRIAFLSDHEGAGRLYSSLPDGSDLRAHSEQDEFYARNASTDGSRVVFQRAGALWLVDDLIGAEPRRIEFSLGGPRTARRARPIPAAEHLGTVSPDAEGRSSLVEVRGTIHRVTHQDGPARVLADAPGVRNRLPQPLPDGASVWVTDAEGEDGLEFSDGRRVAVGALGRVEQLLASPDGAVLAVADRDGAVLLVTVADGTVRELDRSAAVQATGLVFSPDSAWLAWSHGADINERLRQIRLARLSDGGVTEVTPVRFNDHSPAFSADGRYLAFLSIREFDPVYDEHVFDLSFPVACRPYLALLTADTLSPFDPLPQGRRPGKAKEDAAADAAVTVRVDTEGITARLVPFPVEAGRYEALQAVKGGFTWLHRPLTGMLGNAKATPSTPAKRASLEYFDLSTRRLDTLVEAVDRYTVSGDGARLALVDGKELRVVPADRKVAKEDEGEAVTVDLDRIRVTLDPSAEWRQMVAEAARLMRDNFWRVDLGGVDWEAVQDRYRPLVDRLGSHDDLVDLLWEIQGELGTSHAYVQPKARKVADARRLGLLGADLARDGDGSWRIVRILPGESSDPAARSPLAAPGLGIRAGDAVLAVNGRTVEEVAGPAPLLAGTAGKPVELTLGTAEGGEYSVVVVPLADEEPLRYHDWVAGRRARVRELSGGRLGYLHLPDQMSAGWAQLHRDLHTESAQDGLIVDTRENRGGHTSQLVVEKLRRRVVKWQTIRGFRPHPRYPEDAPRGPLVAVADEFSGSDGDNINAAFQAYGLGPVVGVRTWGGVVGIDGHYKLVDGTGVTQPRFRTWFEGYDWGLENHGVDPDVEVVCTPEDWAAGRDPQLEEAVRIALRALEASPAVNPPELPPL